MGGNIQMSPLTNPKFKVNIVCCEQLELQISASLSCSAITAFT